MMTDRDFNSRDGSWFPVMNELADKLITYELTKTEHRVLWMFFRFCYGFNDSTCALRWCDMLDITGLKDGSLGRAINGLKERNIVSTHKSESRPWIKYRINSKLSTWKSKNTHKTDSQYGERLLTVRRAITHNSENDTLYIKTKDKRQGVIPEKKKEKKPEIPVWLDTEIWAEFKKYRQSGKNKFTPYAQRLAIAKLDKLRAAGNDPAEVIKQSIMNGWTGLFEIKKEIREEALVKQKTNAKLEAFKRLESL